jgi:hypothetical protein
MISTPHCGNWMRRCFQVAALAGVCLGSFPSSAGSSLEEVLARASLRVSGLVEQFSDVKCTEQVRQQKLAENGKVERDAQSTYDYLVILTNAGGELSLNESRLPLHEAKADKKNTSLLITNGFATLFLIFHPYYAGSFQFTAGELEVTGGHKIDKISFQYVRGRRSPAVLALRGREYPLPLSGTAWIDPETGAIARIDADIGNRMEDVGLKTMYSAVNYAPVVFRGVKETYWFPADAQVEVETERQHWRNTHVFTDYRRFSVSTEEQVVNQ